MKKLKIALISDWFLPRIGGIELHINDLARELNKQGHEVHVITTTPGLETQDFKVHRLQVPLLPFWKIASGQKLIPLLKPLFLREEFDLIHNHSSVVNPLTYTAVYLSNQLKIPNILTNHSLLEKSVHFFRFLNLIYGWKNWSTVLTSISHAAAEGFQKASGRKEIQILPNGIHIDQWKIPKALNPTLQITSVMRLHRKKRGKALIQAISKIGKKLPKNIQFEFNIIGDGNERSSLEKKVRNLKLQKKVKFLGFCSREEIKKVFEQTDLFILPTLKEALSIAVLEAKAAALPVIAMNYGGVKELIQHGEEGFLAKNDEEFSNYIIQLIQNEHLRKKMSENTLKTVGQFDWSQVIERHLKVYEQAMEKAEPQLR